MRRRVVMICVGAVLALAVWLGARAVEARRFGEELALAREELGSRRFATARARLTRLAERRPGDGEVERLLGDCESALGHPDAALAAWGRIPDGSAQAPAAALASARTAMGLGRFRLAEASLLARQPSGTGDVVDEARAASSSCSTG